MNDIVITPAKLDDIDTLFRWGEENWELWGDDKYKWFSKASLTKWLKDPKDDVLLVARKSGIPIGMFMVLTLRDWAFGVGLFIQKEYRRLGLAKRLLDEATRRLKEKGVESMILLVDTKNEAGIAFYKREKFYQGYPFFMMTKVL
ncbi:MAG: GNAT family N-acetyltransferase [Patescibacteria group bacterium]